MLRGTTVEGYYEGACVYRGDGSPDYILHPEGVVRATGQGLSHEYFLKDHLGNTRVVFGSNGAVLQATDYYAFGLEHTPLAISNANRYLYNGKELQDETFAGGVRLGWYGYGWRFYDPMIGRFTNVDPMAEKFYAWSSHSYGQDNPVGNIDVGGRFVFKDASNYPELARVLQNIQSVLDNQNIMSNLQKFSGLSSDVIRQQFTYEKGPEIKIDDLQWYIQISGQTSDNGDITLDYAMVKHLENALKEGNMDEYNDYLFFIVATILHEYNHSGDLQIDGERSDPGQTENCLGYQFEKATFGSKLKSINDVRVFLGKRTNYVEKENKNEDNKKKNEEFWRTVGNLAPGVYSVVDGKIIPKK